MAANKNTFLLYLSSYLNPPDFCSGQHLVCYQIVEYVVWVHVFHQCVTFLLKFLFVLSGHNFVSYKIDVAWLIGKILAIKHDQHAKIKFLNTYVFSNIY